mmetsp:Transcript_110373/g.356261  ORF Transcript_110373/g.356261 Transcript_110373/m.356261 type:complete len:200 (-) Transcript_110373:240-839(-)
MASKQVRVYVGIHRLQGPRSLHEHVHLGPGAVHGTGVRDRHCVRQPSVSGLYGWHERSDKLPALLPGAGRHRGRRLLPAQSEPPGPRAQGARGADGHAGCLEQEDGGDAGRGELLARPRRGRPRRGRLAPELQQVRGHVRAAVETGLPPEPVLGGVPEGQRRSAARGGGGPPLPRGHAGLQRRVAHQPLRGADQGAADP